MTNFDKLPLLIYETANMHGGNPDILERLIASLAEHAYSNPAVKFHPIEADKLAEPGYSFYSVYKALEIPNSQWARLIKQGRERLGAVWIECADLNCVEVLKENMCLLDGIKLQASILENEEVFSALARIDLSSKVVMLNISGHELIAISTAIQRFQALRPGRIALQVGFQAYPTRVEDTLLNKLAVLKAAFPAMEMAFADHVDATDPFSRRIPLLATALGCSIIEKHACLDRAHTPYDASAALEPTEMAEMVRELTLTARCFSDRFIAEAEAAYLEKTIQRPIARGSLRKGQLVARENLLYRRTDRTGLSFDEITALQTSFNILNRGVEAQQPLARGHFGEAHIATIVAGRMKSSRLPRKAVLRVHGVPSVDRCLENCLRFAHVRTLILATSTLSDDSVLTEHSLGGRAFVWRGDPENVIQRYLGACDAYNIDVVVRVTADCLTVSPEITEILLKKHFASGADYTRARKETPGSAPQIFNVDTLRRVEELSGGAIYSEYMNQYVENNPDQFKINWVDIPDSLIRSYRLTLDYTEDLEMYNMLFAELDKRGQSADLRNVIQVLDSRPDIAAINSHLSMVYTQDKSLMEKIKNGTRFSNQGPLA